MSVFQVVHTKVAVRKQPSTTADIVGVLMKGEIVEGTPRSLSTSQPWLRLNDDSRPDIAKARKESHELWVLIDGTSVGLGQLLKQLTPAEAAKAKEERTKQAARTVVDGQELKPVGDRSRYRVVHAKVVVRKGPSIDERVAGTQSMGDIRIGVPHVVNGARWLQVEEGWILINGKSIGLGMLLEEVGPPKSFAERLADRQKAAQRALEEQAKAVESADAPEDEVALELWQGCPVPLWLPWVPQARRGYGLNRTSSNSSALEWMAKKMALRQDLFLLGPPGSTCRALAFQFCAMTNQEAMYVHIARDTNESDLKQRREISRGTLSYINAPPVESALHGRVLIIEGVEKAERNVLPLLNNLLENREMALESGDFLTSRQDSGAGTLLVKPGFLVIAIGLPVPRYAGTPLDPPLRSRFSAFTVQPSTVQEELETLTEIAPSRKQSDLKLLVEAAGSLRKEGFPRLSEDSLQAVARILQLFESTATLLGTLRMAFPYTLLPMTDETARQVWEVVKDLSSRDINQAEPRVLEVSATSAEQDVNLCRVKVGFPHGEHDVASAPCGALQLDQSELENLPGPQGEVLALLLHGHCALQDMVVVGDRGVGKTHLVRAFSKLLGYRARTVFCYKEMASRELLLRRSTDAEGNTEWRWGPLLQAAIGGDVAVLDGIHRLPRGLLTAAAGRLIMDRALDLPDGRLVPPDHYFALLKSGHSEEELTAANIHVVHPAFRVICTAEPPERVGQMDWLTDELLAMFLFVRMSPLSDDEHKRLLQNSFRPAALDGLLALSADFQTAAVKDPSRYGPLKLSTRRLLQVGRYSAGHSGEEAEALGRVLRPPFALLPTAAQKTVSSMMLEAAKKGLPLVDLKVKLNAEAEAAEARRAVAAVSDEKRKALEQEAVAGAMGHATSNAIADEKNRVERELAQSVANQRARWLQKAQKAVRGQPQTKGGRVAARGEAAVIENGKLRIGNISAKILKPERPELIPHAPFVEIPQHQAVLRHMLLDWTIGHHVLLIGPQGVGKNKLADRLLELLQCEREYIQLHRDSTVSSLVSAPSLVGGTLVWGDSPLVRALKFGRVLVVDEADKAPLEVVCVLKALVEDREYALPDGRLVSHREHAGNVNVIVPAEGFRVVVLANRPGYPFLGNNFYKECGDVFAALVVESPDLDSEAMLVRSYGPGVAEDKLARLLALFTELRLRVDEGILLYPYSTRELVKIVRHLDFFPEDTVDGACCDVFAFDLQDGHAVSAMLLKTANGHGINLFDKPHDAQLRSVDKMEKSLPDLMLKQGLGFNQRVEEAELEEGIKNDAQKKVLARRRSRFTRPRIGSLGSQSKDWGFDVGHVTPFSGGHGLGLETLEQITDEPEGTFVSAILGAVNIYTKLDASREAKFEELRTCYIQAAVRVHPDTNSCAQSSDAFMQVAEAWTICSNAELKRKYDEELSCNDVDNGSSGQDDGLFGSVFMSLEDALGIFASAAKTCPNTIDGFQPMHDRIQGLVRMQETSVRAAWDKACLSQWIFDRYDADGDGYLNLQEAQQVMADTGNDLQEEVWPSLCEQVGCSAEIGLTADGFHKLYAEIGIGNLVEDYWILRDCLYERLPDRSASLIASVLSFAGIQGAVGSKWSVLSAQEGMPVLELCRCYVWMAARLHPMCNDHPKAGNAFHNVTEAFRSLLGICDDAATQESHTNGEALFFAVAASSANQDCSSYFAENLSSAMKLLSHEWCAHDEPMGNLSKQGLCDWIFRLRDTDGDGLWNFQDTSTFLHDLGKDEIEEDMWTTLLEQVGCELSNGLTADGLHKAYTELGLGDISEDYWTLWNSTNESSEDSTSMVPRILGAKDCHEILAAPIGLPAGELRRFYLRIAATVHPSACTHPLASTAFRRVAEAWAILGNEDLRQCLHKAQLHLGQARLNQASNEIAPTKTAGVASCKITLEQSFAIFARAVESMAASVESNTSCLLQHGLTLMRLHPEPHCLPLEDEQQKAAARATGEKFEVLSRLVGTGKERGALSSPQSTDAKPGVWLPWVPSQRRSLGLQRTGPRAEVLQWMAKKVALQQDMFLLGPPGSACRTLAMQFCAMTNQEAMYIHIARDTNESDLKQRREISKGSLYYINAAPVEAAINGRVLIIEGVEKAERNVLPLLNNLLENREMALESGEFLTPRHMPGSSTLLVRPGFLVIAIGLPVPRFAGTPLDPPLRSRFAAFNVEPPSREDELQALKAVAPSKSEQELRSLLDVAIKVRKDGLPRLPEESLLAIARLWHMFGATATAGSALRMAYPESMLPLEEEAAKYVAQAFKDFKPGMNATVSEVSKVDEPGVSLCTLKIQGLAAAPDVVSASSGPLPSDMNALGTLSGPQSAALIQLLQGHSVMQDLMILGERGVGKTHVIRAFARLLGYRVRTVFCFKEMSSRELFARRGTDSTGNTEWQWGPLIQAAIHGDIVVLDGVHRLPHGLLAAAVGRLVADRTLDLPDGRLVPVEHYYALLHSGRTVKELRAERIFPVHPAFRIICAAEPPHRQGPTCWLADELLALFLFVALAPLTETHHQALLNRSLPSKVIAGLVHLGSTFDKAAKKELSIYRPMQLSTRRLLQIARYAAAPMGSIDEALGRVLRPPFALLPESAQRKVLLMVEEAKKVGLPHVELNLRQALEAEMAASKRVAMPEAVGDQLKQEAINMVFGFGSTKNILKEREQHEKENVANVLTQRVDRFKEAQKAIQAVPSGRSLRQDVAEISDGVLRIGNVKAKVLQPERPELVPNAPFVEIPQHQEVLRQMLLDWTIGNHMLLLGPQGVGKNKLADRLLELLQAEREYTQLHRDTTVSSLVSAPSLVGGAVVWGDSPMVRALRCGRVLVLDEADKAPLEVVCILKALVEDGEFALPDGRLVTRHGDANDPNIIIPKEGFRVIVLANRPGFPFLGNDFFAECGDIFSALIVESPDLHSEAMLLRSYAPTVETEKMSRLLALFTELRLRVEEGTLLYPYSTRELVKIVTHLETFPDDEIDTALLDVFAFDLQEGSGVIDLLKKAADSHKLDISKRLAKMEEAERLEQRMKVMLARRGRRLRSDSSRKKMHRHGEKDVDNNDSEYDESEQDSEEVEEDFEGWDEEEESEASEDDDEVSSDEEQDEEEMDYVSPSRTRRLAAKRIGKLGAQSKGWGFKVGRATAFTGGFGLRAEKPVHWPLPPSEPESDVTKPKMSLSQRQVEETAAVAAVLGAEDHYQALACPRDASTVEVQMNYLKMAVRVHPKKNHHPDSTTAFVRVTQAWLVLRDEESRRHYDLQFRAIANNPDDPQTQDGNMNLPNISWSDASEFFKEATIAAALAFANDQDDPRFVAPLLRAQRLVQSQQQEEKHEKQRKCAAAILEAPDCYSILQSPKQAPTSQLQEQYLRLAVGVHPAKNRQRNAKDAFIRISAAWALLQDEDSRLTYDLELHRLGSRAKPLGNGIEELEDVLGREFSIDEARATFQEVTIALSSSAGIGSSSGAARGKGSMSSAKSAVASADAESREAGTNMQSAGARSTQSAGAADENVESAGNDHNTTTEHLQEHVLEAQDLVKSQEQHSVDHDLSPEQHSMCEWMFERYDVDIDGFLNLKETKQMTKDLGDELEDDMWQFFVEQVDCDPKDGMTLEGLCKVYSRLPGGNLEHDHKLLQDLASQESEPEAASVASVLAAKDHYAVLGSRRDAKYSDLRKCYLKTALRVHPDKNPHPDAKVAFQRVADAWSVLGDEEQRRRYDEWLRGGSRDVPSAAQADAFSAFARAAQEASDDGNKDSFAETLREAQQMTKKHVHRKEEEQQPPRSIHEEQQEQARKEMEQAKADGTSSSALAGLMAGGHSKKRQDKFRKQLKDSADQRIAEQHGKQSNNQAGGDSRRGSEAQARKSGRSNGANRSKAGILQSGGVVRVADKRNRKTQAKGREKRGKTSSQDSKSADREAPRQADGHTGEGEGNQQGEDDKGGSGGKGEGGQDGNGKEGNESSAADESGPGDEKDTASEAPGMMDNKKHGDGGGNGGAQKQGSSNGKGGGRGNGSGKGVGNGKGKGKGRGPGRGVGSGGTGQSGKDQPRDPNSTATSISKQFDKNSKVWRPGDADAEKGKGHEELNVYDLFEEEPMADFTAPSLNYSSNSTYELLKTAVATQVAQMREMLRNHEAKEKEREWKRGLADGELDDLRLVEAACGDQNVFRRRIDSTNPALLASKPKRILIACDLSPSMSVLDKVDDRLRRLQEALVFIFESFTGFAQKYDYMITGFSAAGYDYVFVPWARPPRTATQRLAVLDSMVKNARHGPPGDGTLAATEWAIKEIRKREGDEYFVFIISDAELTRHDISPEEWNKLLMADPQVNAYAIIISMSSSETRMFLDGIDQGHGFACEQRDELAGIFKKVFSETLTKEAP